MSLSTFLAGFLNGPDFCVTKLTCGEAHHYDAWPIFSQSFGAVKLSANEVPQDLRLVPAKGVLWIDQ